MTSLFPVLALFTAAVLASIYVISSGYLFPRAQILHYIDDLYQCSEFPYPDTYFRKRVQEQNYSYTVYNIQIGKIISRNMSQSQRQKIEGTIQKDLLQNQLHPDKKSEHRVQMRAMYEKYYNEFHYDGVLRCAWNNPKTVDFFSFIQPDAKLAENAIAVPIEYVVDNDATHYLIELPTDHVPTFKTEHTDHLAPQLFSYTLSVHPSGRLNSLEFRFGEINSAIQHEDMRHLALNGVHTHLLWAGEFWYFFDHNDQQYVLVMDNDSGHWKPEMYAKPQYLEDILLQSLFPDYVYQNNTNERNQPVLMVGYDEDPWKRIKVVLFPVIAEIHERDFQKYQRDIEQYQQYMHKMQRQKYHHHHHHKG